MSEPPAEKPESRSAPVLQAAAQPSPAPALQPASIWMDRAVRFALRLQHPAEMLIVLVIAAFGFLAATWYPVHFDEIVSLGYLSNLARGNAAHTGFWCVYPVPALEIYRLLVGPWLHDMYVLIGLRVICFCLSSATLYYVVLIFDKLRVPRIVALLLCLLYVSDYQLLNYSVILKIDALSDLLLMVALLLMVTAEETWTLAVCGFVSTCSVLMMPKGAFILGFTTLAAFRLAYDKQRLRGLAKVCGGCAAGVLVTHLLCVMAGTSLIQDITYTTVLFAKFESLASEMHAFRVQKGFVNGCLIPYLMRNLGFTMILILSLAASITRFKERNRRFNIAFTVLCLGSFSYAIAVHESYGQYLNPFILPLLIVPGIALAMLPAGSMRNAAACAISVVCGLSIATRPLSIFQLTESGVFLDQVNQWRRLQNYLKPGEYVLSAPLEPPFATPLTFVTMEERPPILEQCVPDAWVKKQFSVETLRQALKDHHPAMVIANPDHFPVSWRPVLIEYLRHNWNNYAATLVEGHVMYVLKRQDDSAPERK